MATEVSPGTTKGWQLGSMQVNHPTQIKRGSHFLLLFRELPQLYGKNLICPKGTFQTCFEFQTTTLLRKTRGEIDVEMETHRNKHLNDS